MTFFKEFNINAFYFSCLTMVFHEFVSCLKSVLGNFDIILFIKCKVDICFLFDLF